MSCGREPWLCPWKQLFISLHGTHGHWFSRSPRCVWIRGLGSAQSCQASLGPTKLCCLLCDFWQLHASIPQFPHLQNSSQTTGLLAAPREPLESKGPLVSPVSRLNSSVISRVGTQLVPSPFNRHTIQTQSVQEIPNHIWLCTQNNENTRV